MKSCEQAPVDFGGGFGARNSLWLWNSVSRASVRREPENATGTEKNKKRWVKTGIEKIATV